MVPQPVEDLPEVARARAEHLAAFEQTKLRDASLKAEINLGPVPDQIVNGVVPVKTIATTYEAPRLPVAHTVPVSYTPVALGPYAAKIEAEDHLGQYSYGYVGKCLDKKILYSC